MTKPIQLMTAAVAAFEQWRKIRKHPTEKTPEILQQQVVVLLSFRCAESQPIDVKAGAQNTMMTKEVWAKLQDG